jgi:CheY-like chemotaxis protein
VLLNLLEPLGFEIILAEHGREGVDKAHDMHPELILMDLVMPVMTGFEAVKEIRRIPELADVPIIAISASTVDMDQEQSRALGCQAFLLKPFQAPDLFALLETYLPITWLYEKSEAADNAVPQPVEADELVPPPQEELTVLHELAKLGKMRGIREQADHLEALDDRYIPFANRLRELAKAFQGKTIVELVAHYIKEAS